MRHFGYAYPSGELFIGFFRISDPSGERIGSGKGGKMAASKKYLSISESGLSTEESALISSSYIRAL